jgi:putative hemolysin
MDTTHLLLYILGCIILIGFFAGIEIAFVSVNKLNIELRKKQGSVSGRILSRFMEEPAEFIGISLIGVNILLVIYGSLMTKLTVQFRVCAFGVRYPCSYYCGTHLCRVHT